MAALFVLIAALVLRRAGVATWIEPEALGDGVVLLLVLAGTIGVALLAIGASVLPWNRPGAGHRAWSRSARRTRLVSAFAPLWLAAAILGFGWFDLVQQWIGDWILVDEAITIAPAIAAMIIAWSAHSAFVVRHTPSMSRVAIVLTQARIFLPLLLVPVGTVLAAQEVVARIMPAGSAWSEWVGLGCAIAALLLAPALVIPALSTAPLPERGDLRERMEALFTKNKVRVCEVRLWNTGGTMMNGVALGILPRVRWVLLTDALIDSLTDEEALAVAGHEAGHLRHRHMAWLAGACIGGVGAGGVGITTLMEWWAPPVLRGAAGEWVALGLLLGLVVLFFGTMSRLCERQADAYAAVSLSPCETIEPAAVEAMRRALAIVAYANGIPPTRPSFRHGSIDSRRRRLAALSGVAKRNLPVDRQMRWMQGLIVLAIVVTLLDGLIALPPLRDGGSKMTPTESAMKFVKMQGLGNDYVYVDADEERIDDPASMARCVSDRHFGIGSDGLILISRPSEPERADARMRMFNADGSEGEMCGNGIRCVAKFVVDSGRSKAKPLRVETARGVLDIDWRLGPDGRVSTASVSMGEPILAMSRIPAAIPGVDAGSPVVDHPLPAAFFGELDGSWRRLAGLEPAITLVSLGNPHVVLYASDLDAIPLERVGPHLERHPWFPQRINVHFVTIRSPREVRMRTWERGSGITLACGTGASAVCVAGVLTGRSGPEIMAHLPGGALELAWPGVGRSVRMSGPAIEVFRGELAAPPRTTGAGR
ncbi:MAG: diaminopimelate epimerase [Phycisphaeraceae bacterium]|nr:diaminopimelate epimerase [Phycisphaeraceae bacterium]